MAALFESSGPSRFPTSYVVTCAYDVHVFVDHGDLIYLLLQNQTCIQLVIIFNGDQATTRVCHLSRTQLVTNLFILSKASACIHHICNTSDSASCMVTGLSNAEA